ncbi:hypothetical protein BJP36_42685 [Moorena producens JHB]|uniref:Uncharacterized protein n=1 Tax=Moorena producens (strain JHB) TaxID=1454205 RepID=A0A9Q9SVC1_MOOP1|nr:hypothetical protein [Moorena producens]WAN70277.1 hypothetical protein BJP36_42685 [Moorena producens JHB]
MKNHDGSKNSGIPNREPTRQPDSITFSLSETFHTSTIQDKVTPLFWGKHSAISVSLISPWPVATLEEETVNNTRAKPWPKAKGFYPDFQFFKIWNYQILRFKVYFK